jgi:hypothetical protein
MDNALTPRLLTAFALGACGFTLAWVAWGLVTPGDYFANGSGLFEPTVLVAIVGGLIAGFKLPARWRIAAVLLTVLCVCFWLFVPSDWWVKPLHGSPE